jgi:hypothetical protein
MNCQNQNSNNTVATAVGHSKCVNTPSLYNFHNNLKKLNYNGTNFEERSAPNFESTKNQNQNQSCKTNVCPFTSAANVSANNGQTKQQQNQIYGFNANSNQNQTNQKKVSFHQSLNLQAQQPHKNLTIKTTEIESNNQSPMNQTNFESSQNLRDQNVISKNNNLNHNNFEKHQLNISQGNSNNTYQLFPNNSNNNFKLFPNTPSTRMHTPPETPPLKAENSKKVIAVGSGATTCKNSKNGNCEVQSNQDDAKEETTGVLPPPLTNDMGLRNRGVYYKQESVQNHFGEKSQNYNQSFTDSKSNSNESNQVVSENNSHN